MKKIGNLKKEIALYARKYIHKISHYIVTSSSNHVNYFTNATLSIRILYLITWCLFILMLFILPQFLLFIQHRNNTVVFDDPLLKLFHPVPKNLSILIIFVSDLPVVLAFIWLIKYPTAWLKGIIACILMFSTRVLSMYLLPLDPPVENVPLLDPFLYGENIITKDLFFSGHIGILVLCWLAVNNKLLKKIFLLALFFTTILLLLQHIHYTVDLIIAPFVSFTCYVVANRVYERVSKN